MNTLANSGKSGYNGAMKAFALVLCLAGFAAAADIAPPAPAPAGLDEATRVKIIDYMLKTPLNEADPMLVSGFMKLDPDAQPKKLRDKVRGKQMEIDAVVKMHNGKKKGPFRDPVPTCNPKYYKGPEGLKTMQMIQGNDEITWEEEEYVEKKSNCPEEQLMCEFSLNIVVLPRPGKPPIKRFFMMVQDPLMAFVAEKRGGGGSVGNRYFEETKPTCKKF
jgi:hypothetical protein